MNLTELREVFREDFRNQDYCIGQECVENLFRKLLNEEEPSEIRDPSSKPINYANASDIFATEINKFSSKISNVFESDDTFYQKLFKKN